MSGSMNLQITPRVAWNQLWPGKKVSEKDASLTAILFADSASYVTLLKVSRTRQHPDSSCHGRVCTDYRTCAFSSRLLRTNGIWLSVSRSQALCLNWRLYEGLHCKHKLHIKWFLGLLFRYLWPVDLGLLISDPNINNTRKWRQLGTYLCTLTCQLLHWFTLNSVTYSWNQIQRFETRHIVVLDVTVIKWRNCGNNDCMWVINNAQVSSSIHSDDGLVLMGLKHARIPHYITPLRLEQLTQHSKALCTDLCCWLQILTLPSCMW